MMAPANPMTTLAVSAEVVIAARAGMSRVGLPVSKCVCALLEASTPRSNEEFWRLCSQRMDRRSLFADVDRQAASRSEEHTSELQSRLHLVCRLLLEKKKKNRKHMTPQNY